jgi:hypothetical protein
VYAVDVRGFGLTPGFPRDTSVLANRDLVVSFISHLSPAAGGAHRQLDGRDDLGLRRPVPA